MRFYPDVKEVPHWRRMRVFILVVIISTLVYYYGTMNWYQNADEEIAFFIGHMTVTLIIYHYFGKSDVGICSECLEAFDVIWEEE